MRVETPQPRPFALLFLLLSCASSAQTVPASQSEEPIAPIHAPFSMPALARPVFPDRSFDIRDFGATPGGSVKNTAAIRKAIETAATAGGGRVIIPAGKWLTGPIHLENNINLVVSAGAEVLFSQDVKDYLPVVFSRHEDTECYKYSAFIYANGKKNIAVTGGGILNGQGRPWWSFKEERKAAEARVIEMGNDNIPVEQRIFDGTGGNELRPAFFQPMNCTNVLVEGVTFRYGAFWTITPTYCENVIVRRVTIVTLGAEGHTPNGDGVDPSSCTNVLIEYCSFDTGDDCIAIKSGRDRDGLRVARPTENVVVRHCIGLSGHGGIVIGSETSGGVRNVYASDCTFHGTDRIVRIKTARGRGGVIENMWFERLSADTIQREAIRLNMLYTGTRFPEQPVTRVTPSIRNIYFSNISCDYAKAFAVQILGLPEMNVEQVEFSGLRISSAKGICIVDARSIRLTNADVRPDESPVLDLTDVQNVTIDSLSVPPGADPLIRAGGGKTTNVLVRHTNTSRAVRPVIRSAGVAADAVRIE